MLDNLENKVIESFDNYEIKLTGNDILTKFRNKKVKKVNKPALILSACFADLSLNWVIRFNSPI